MIKKGGYFVVTYVDIIKKWKEKKIDSIEKLDQQLSNFRIIFAYNSGAIENSQITYHDTREIFENGKVVNFSGDTRTIFEIENQRKCYNYLAPKIINKDPITSDFVKMSIINLCKVLMMSAVGQGVNDLDNIKYMIM